MPKDSLLMESNTTRVHNELLIIISLYCKAHLYDVMGGN